MFGETPTIPVPKAIYTSPFFRCKKTAKIINQHLSLPIYTDDRLNEMGSFQGETWIDLQTRVREAIKDIIYSYDDNDAVICVTSGINVISFISLALRQQPSKDYPYIGIPSCSPMIFEIKKEYFI